MLPGSGTGPVLTLLTLRRRKSDNSLVSKAVQLGLQGNETGTAMSDPSTLDKPPTAALDARPVSFGAMHVVGTGSQSQSVIRSTSWLEGSKSALPPKTTKLTGEPGERRPAFLIIIPGMPHL